MTSMAIARNAADIVSGTSENKSVVAPIKAAAYIVWQ